MTAAMAWLNTRAHIEGVASDKVARSVHTSQDHPQTIKEIKRILREQPGIR